MPPDPPAPRVDLRALLRGERTAIARALTAIENATPESHVLIKAISPHLGRALVVGFTGAPGVGKSTLIAAYVRALRQRGRSVGILATDPSSERTGGAVLGDRIRMLSAVGDPAVYMRSFGARGHLGGLSAAVAQAVDVLDAAGKDVVVVETVGVGQSEIAIAGLAHSSVVVCGPGFGDAVQAIKAGVLEIADVLVINKSDQTEAGRVRSELSAALSLLPCEARRPTMIDAVATEGVGIPELLAATGDRGHEAADDIARERRRRAALALRDTAGALVRRCLADLDDGTLNAALEGLLSGQMTWAEATGAVLQEVARTLDRAREDVLGLARSPNESRGEARTSPEPADRRER